MYDTTVRILNQPKVLSSLSSPISSPISFQVYVHNMLSQWRWIYPDMFPHWRSTYQLVDDTNNLEKKQVTSPKIEQVARPYQKLAVVVTTLTFGTTILIAFALYFMFASHAEDIQAVGPCGNSSIEAIARGCSFDQLMWAWYPKHCPHYANEEYLHSEPDEPWRFYIDPYQRKVASEEEWADALDNKVSVYGERREHLTHCVFMYLSLGQLIRDKTRYTPRQVEYEHLEHCAGILLEALRNDTNWYQVQTKAPKVFYDQDC